MAMTYQQDSGVKLGGMLEYKSEAVYTFSFGHVGVRIYTKHGEGSLMIKSVGN